MKRIFLSLLLFSFTLCVYAQRFDYDLDFNYLFSNYEHDISNNLYENSYTLFATRLTPSIGFLVNPSGDAEHRIMAGVDIYKDFGSNASALDLLQEAIFYYRYDSGSHARNVKVALGCFPRSFLTGDYSRAFFDDDLMFLDNNLEGALFTYSGKKLTAEVAIDWNGHYAEEDPYNREVFKFLLYGKWNFAGSFNLGWTASLNHFACAPALPNVVDNNLLNFRAGWTPSGSLFDKVDITAGILIAPQCDRKWDSSMQVPYGLLTRQKLCRWKVHIDNTFYYGMDLMTFYEHSYNGVQYGDRLYSGDLMFHTRIDGGSWADYLNISYEPTLYKWLKLSVGCSFQLGQSPDGSLSIFRGWQQYLSLRFDLASIQNKK